MRHGLRLLASTSFASISIALAACASARPPAPDPPAAASVRERLEATTRLPIAGATSAGTIIAERKLAEGWTAATSDLHIENGEVIVSSDARDAVTLEGFQVAFAPIDLPEGVFGDHVAQLTHIRIDLANEQRLPAVWVSDDEVRLSARLDLALAWTLTLNGSPIPLGLPDLPPIPVELVLTGDGLRVEADLRAYAAGELWSWAGLVRLRELELIVGALTEG